MNEEILQRKRLDLQRSRLRRRRVEDVASYENEENRNKEINHGSLITLADFYEVSIDYLFCRTENREQINTPLSELHLTDEAVALLKSGRINTRLLCEMMSHKKFAELMADAEIYVDGMATMRFHDLNSALAAVRAMILEEYPEAAADRSLEILKAGLIKNSGINFRRRPWK